MGKLILGIRKGGEVGGASVHRVWVRDKEVHLKRMVST